MGTINSQNTKESNPQDASQCGLETRGVLIAYATIEEIYDRLRRRTPPDGEFYAITKPQGKFSCVGVYCYNEFIKIFHIYTARREIYDHVCGMVKDAASRIGFGFEVKVEVWDESKKTL